MDEFLKTLLEIAVKEEKVCAVQVGKEPNKDSFAEVKKDSAKIAQLHKILYDAHIEVGFTKEEALALTIATATIN